MNCYFEYLICRVPHLKSQGKVDNVNFHFLNNYRNHVDTDHSLKNGISGGSCPASVRNNERSGSCSSGGGGAADNSQPLYVNAPPKPRRVTDPSEPNIDNDFGNGSSPTAVADPEVGVLNDLPRSQPYAKKVLSNVTQSYLTITERRTPDVYGRSSSIDPRSLTYSRCKVYKQSNAADYEELYNLTTMNHTESSDHRNRPRTSLGSPVKSPLRFNQVAPNNDKISRLSLQNRPRSVDFLEAENKLRDEKMLQATRSDANSAVALGPSEYNRYVPPPRPKSSIDVVNADSFYWSEERYAENMRKSAQFLVGKKLPQRDLLKLPYRNSSYDSSGVSSSSPGDNIASIRKLTNDVGYDDEEEENVVVRSRTFESSQMVTAKCTSQTLDKRWNNYSPTTTLSKNRDDCSARGDFIRSKSARIPREKLPDERCESAFGESSSKRRNSLHSSEAGDRNSQQTQQVMCDPPSNELD